MRYSENELDKTNISSKYNNRFFKAEIIGEIDGNNRDIVAFSGIGDNDGFFQTLENPLRR